MVCVSLGLWGVWGSVLVHMYKMPRIWKEYCVFLMKQKKIHETRIAFDRALRALPITQHAKWIWPSYLEFANECKVAETGMRVWRRYLKLYPDQQEDYMKYLKKVGKIEEAVLSLADMVNNDKFVSQHGKSKHDLWQELLKLLVQVCACNVFLFFCSHLFLFLFFLFLLLLLLFLFLFFNFL